MVQPENPILGAKPLSKPPEDKGHAQWLPKLARETYKCFKKKTYEKRLSNGMLSVEPADLLRCPFLVLSRIEKPELVEEWYSREEVIIRSLFKHGVLKLFESGTRRREDVNVLLPLETTVLDYSPSGRRVRLPISRGEVSIKRVSVSGELDLYLPWEGEAILVRYTGSTSSLPRPHHVEEAIIYQWLLAENGYRVERARILYYYKLERLHGEYVVESRLSRSMRFRHELRRRIAERLETLLESEKRPWYKWQCYICQMRDHAREYGFDCPGSRGEVEPAGEPLVRDGDYMVWEDKSLKATLTVYRALIEDNLEKSRWKRGRRRRRALHEVQANVTSITGCPYKFWFTLMIPYTTATLPLKGNVSRGDIIHHGLQFFLEKLRDCPEILEREGIERVRSEVPVEGVYRIRDTLYTVSGRIDLVIEREDYEGNDLVVDIVELKTTPFENLDRYGPSKKYLNQLKVYLDLYRQILASKSEEAKLTGHLVYVEATRETGLRTRSYNQEPPQENYTRQLLEKIHSIAVGGDASVKEYSWECKWCPFKDLCPARREVGQE